MCAKPQVTVKDALKNPKIIFTPKQKMRDAANSVELSIDRPSTKADDDATTTTPGTGEGGEDDGNHQLG